MNESKETTKKWASTAGPRQTKQVNEALGKLRWEHNTFVELTGVTGVDEHSYTFNSIFGSSNRADVSAVQTKLGDKYGWTVTRENYAQIIADVSAELPALEASRPIKDQRRTPEQDAERNQKQAQADAKRAEQAAVDTKQRDERLIELRRDYPWAEQSGSRWARGSKNCKRLLSDLFPGVQFSTKSDSYSGGSSIDVSWELGPMTNEVDTVADKFQYADFDGMTDSTNHRTGTDGGAFRDWMGSAKYVSCGRTIPEAALKAVTEGLAELWPDRDAGQLMQDVNVLFSETSFPAGAVITGVERTDSNGSQCRILFRETAPMPVATEGASHQGQQATVKLNPAKGGVEIHFPAKPDAATIASVKASGFRWSRFSACWYHRANAGRIQRACQIAGLTEAESAALVARFTNNTEPATA